MWELDHKEGWVLKNWCFQTVMLEKTPESPLDSKELKPVNPKGNQPWVFTGSTEAPILWPPDAKSRLTGKDPDAGKDRGHEEKGMREDEMLGWHHWLNGHESEQTLGGSEGQGSLPCCSPWGLKESDTTEQLNTNPDQGGERYTDHYKTLIKGTEDNSKKWKTIPCPWNGGITITKLAIWQKVIYCNVMSIKLPMAFFTELEQQIQKFIGNH